MNKKSPSLAAHIRTQTIYSKRPYLMIGLLFTVASVFITSNSLTKAQTDADNKVKTDLIIQTGHKFEKLELSEEQKLMLTGGDQTTKLWQMDKGVELKTFEGDHAVFSPKTGLFANNLGSTITLWDINTGAEVLKINGHGKDGHKETVVDLQFTPDGTKLLSASLDSTVRVWDAKTGRLLRLFDSHKETWVRSIDISPDGKLVISAGGNEKILLWELNSGKILAEFPSHTGAVRVEFTSDGKRFISSSQQDKNVYVWDIKAKKKVLELHKDWEILSFAQSPDDQILAISPVGDDIYLHNAKTGQEIAKLEHDGWVQGLQFTKDGRTLISAGYDKTLRFWDVASRKELRRIASSVSETSSGAEVSFSGNGRYILYTTYDGNTNLWDNETLSFKVYDGEKAKFSNDSSILVTANDDENTHGGLKFWDPETGGLLASHRSHSHSITRLSFSPDGNFLATSSRDKTIGIWDVKTRELTKMLEGHEAGVEFVTTSSDSKTLASFDSKNIIKTWDAGTGKPLFEFKKDDYGKLVFTGEPANLNAIYISPDNTKLFARSMMQLALWDINTGAHLDSLDLKEMLTLPSSVLSFNTFLSRFSSRYDALSASGKIYITNSEYGLEVYDETSRRLGPVGVTRDLLATLIGFKTGEWVVKTPDGRFDTNKSLDQIDGLHWVIDGRILNPMPLEVFMRDYYEPGLLPRLLKCTEENTCDKEFKPVRDLTELNRTQPKVGITAVSSKQSAVGG
ncbi:MAG: WD40 repeat domain-containing protein, partial [Acidobacteria bacterium]|nr:WD40 repeat domain-containing protein [Acidobacteriota bacterium]